MLALAARRTTGRLDRATATVGIPGELRVDKGACGRLTGGESCEAGLLELLSATCSRRVEGVAVVAAEGETGHRRRIVADFSRRAGGAADNTSEASAGRGDWVGEPAGEARGDEIGGDQ